jgi:hypothetical protein
MSSKDPRLSLPHLVSLFNLLDFVQFEYSHPFMETSNWYFVLTNPSLLKLLILIALQIADHASNSYCENKAYILKKQQPVEVEAEAKDQRQQQPSPKEAFQTHPDSKTNTSTDFSSEINEESPLFGSERSTVTNDSIKLEEEKDVEHGGRKLESTSFRSTLLGKKNKKKSNKDDKVEKAAGTPSSSHSSSSPSSETPFRKSKSYSSGASSMLRNLIGCGAADTNDAAFVMLNRANKTDSSTKPDVKDENFQGEKLGGSARVYGATWNQQQQEQQQQQQHGTNW